MNTPAYQTVIAIYRYWRRALWNYVVYGIVCSAFLSVLCRVVAGSGVLNRGLSEFAKSAPAGGLKGCLVFTYDCFGRGGEQIVMPFPVRITIMSANPGESTSSRQRAPLTPPGGPWLDDQDRPIWAPVESSTGTYCIHVELQSTRYGVGPVVKDVVATVKPGMTTFVRITSYDIVKIWQVVNTRYTYKFTAARAAGASVNGPRLAGWFIMSGNYFCQRVFRVISITGAFNLRFSLRTESTRSVTCRLSGYSPEQASGPDSPCFERKAS